MTRTNAYSLLCMIIRAVAIWGAARFAIGLPGLVFAFKGTHHPSVTAALLLGVTFAGLVLLGALWLYAGKLARLALVRPEEVVFDSSIGPQTWLGIAVAAMGAWLVVNAMIDAAYHATRFFAVSAPLYDEKGLFALVLPDMVATALQLIFGVVLVLRGQGLSRWIHRLRYGVEPQAVDPAS